MRKLALGMILAGFVGAAAAEGNAIADMQYADGNDYAAKVYYSLDFGRGHAQSLGLRFDNVLAASHGAPALFQARLDGRSSLPTLSLQGVDIAGPALAANQDETPSLLGNLTLGQILGIVFTGFVFTGILYEASNNDEPSPAGTGSGY
jgi:hypothetical protein